ncbi:MAG: glucose-1-phosphate adenylyltransferase, partial [Chloroflexi bacterium]|nr:glucose-1-phosphate adenylyltransferase [Chloroflexota bacterium]
LTAKRTKPAVPFAGKYRIIDFTLSNCVNSGLFDVMILAQYRPHSLIEHIASGRPWDLDRSFTGGVRVHTPYKGRADTDWYLGTADAVQQNFSFIKEGRPEFALILSGDHIYEMNYDPLLAFHLDHEADCTICTISVTLEEATRFGILATDEDYRVTDFVEKPGNPPGTQASMGVYVFSMGVLDRMLMEDHLRRDSAHDFGKDILPRMIRAGMRVFAYPYNGNWVDVGTIDSYWQAHMDLVSERPRLNLNDRTWIVHTRSEERPPVMVHSGAKVLNSWLTDGTVVAPGALVERSVIAPGVYIGPDTVIRESVILTDAVIEGGARIERAIIDKRVQVGHNAVVGTIDPGLAGVCQPATVADSASWPHRIRRFPLSVLLGFCRQPVPHQPGPAAGGQTAHPGRPRRPAGFPGACGGLR